MRLGIVPATTATDVAGGIIGAAFAGVQIGLDLHASSPDMPRSKTPRRVSVGRILSKMGVLASLEGFSDRIPSPLQAVTCVSVARAKNGSNHWNFFRNCVSHRG
ncbi:hypothetical protein SPHINGOT1_10146 [Sphingomonas sp. T1]|nr:hypothetical protein SPHINGOT1_10146 [Sphingomonas sp. T1]